MLQQANKRKKPHSLDGPQTKDKHAVNNSTFYEKEENKLRVLQLQGEACNPVL